jgi:geranylgeranyl diphosphate synthase type I
MPVSLPNSSSAATTLGAAEQIQESISLLEKSGSIEYARSRAEEMVQKGKQALQVLPDSKAKATLLELADYMVRRQY